MSYNGAGTYTLPLPNVVTGTVISSTWANTTLTNIASALSSVICKDGQTTVTANIPLGGFKITNLAAGSAAADAVRYDQLSAVVASLLFSQTTSYSQGTIGLSLQRFPSVVDAPYNVVMDSATDQTSAIQDCIDDHGGAYIPIGNVVAAGLTLTSNQCLQGADRYLTTITNTTNAATVTISGNYNSIRNLGFIGSGKGATYNAGLASNVGVDIVGGGTAGFNNVVDNCYFYNHGRAGYRVTQTNAGTHQPNQFTNNLCASNNTGIEAAVQGEYINCAGTNCWTNHYGMYIRGGNFLAPGCIINDNLTGVYLANGSNDSHGILSGALINHNVDYNIRSENITNGFVFDGCAAYEGDILYTSAVGIVFQNGIIDAINYYFDGSTGCAFKNNLLPGGYANTINNNYNGNASWTKWVGNRPLTGIQPSAEVLGGYSAASPVADTYAPGFAESTLDFTSPSNAVYNQSVFTKYTFWNAGTKRWTVFGLHDNKVMIRAQIRVTLNAADNPNNLYMYLYKNATTNIGYFTRTVINTTTVAFTFMGNPEFVPTDTIEVRIGTSTALANNVVIIATSPSYIQLEGL